MIRVPFACLAACLLTAAVAWSAAQAAEPELVTDRPDQTESSTVVQPGRVQLEAGWSFSREDEGGLETDTQEIPATLARIGLVEGVELRVGWAGFVSEEIESGGSPLADADGAGDMELGAKVYLREERGRRPEAALLFGASLPVGDDDLSSERVDPSFRFSLSHTISERIGLGYNVGMNWSSAPDGSGERDTLSRFIYTVASGISLSERLAAFVELYGELGGSASGSPEHAFDGGFTYLLRDNLQLDLAGGFGLSDDADDWFLGAGVSVRFPK